MAMARPDGDLLMTPTRMPTLENPAEPDALDGEE
jgi:hypothetical protein